MYSLIQELLICRIQRFPNRPQLLKLYMLDPPLDLHQTFPCDRNALQVHHPHKLNLPDSP